MGRPGFDRPWARPRQELIELGVLAAAWAVLILLGHALL
jgi:hypothetical protein